MNIKNLYSKKELVFLGTLFIAALISLFFFINFRTLAFPEHNIKFDITREQAAEEAKDFVSELGFDPGSYKETTVFSIDTTTKTYLERETGVTETAELASDEVAVWQFTTRFFKPLEKEEISVAHLPNGRLSGYFREIEEAAPGASLSAEQARGQAEEFLRNTVDSDINNWRFIDSERIERPERVDYTFTWEKQGFEAADAEYRMDVHVYGDTIGGYIEYLKIPEEWVRAYEKETSNNDLAQLIAEALMLLVFGLAILIIFILQYRRNNLRIASFRIIWIITVLITLLTTLNSLPLALAGYPTTMSWEAFLGSVILISILGAFFQGASVLLVIAAGETKFREMFPRMQSLEASIRRGLRTKEVNKALFIGVFVGIIFFTYELLYYFLGRQVGFWAPADINYADMFSTYLPWIYPLFVGFMAAASEEGIFRLFGIPFLKKYLKSTWAAILITSIIWAFLHSNYPQSPWFVRGIEISVIGVVLGWLFVRYGFWASFTAHYTFNALQTAIYFFASGSLYASVSSTAVSLLPLIIAVGFLGIGIHKKGFVPLRKEDLNSSLALKKESPPKKVIKLKEIKYKPITNAWKQYLIALSMLSLFLLWALYPQTSLEQVPTSVGRQEVITKAEEALAKQGVETENYKQVAEFTPEDITFEEDYILEKEDFETLQRIYPEKLPLAHWTVRYFKALEKEEYTVDVLPDGSIYQIVHVLDEKAPGANLPTSEAQKIAESYLSGEKNYDLGKYNLVENKDKKKENRTDHTFVYEEIGTQIGEAAFRTEVIVKGEEISGYERYLKLPEEWLREKTETRTLDFAVGGLIGLFVLMVLWFGFKTFFDLVRGRQLRFRTAYKISAVVTVFSIIATVNSLSTFYSAYDTAIPLSTYIVQSVLATLMGLVVTFFIFAIVFGMFIAIWKQYVGQIIPTDMKDRTQYIKDAVIAGYSIPIILSGISTGLLYILITNDWLESVATFDTFPQLDTYSPLISVIAELPLAAGGFCFIAVSIILLRKHFKSWKKVLGSLVIVAVLAGIPQQRTWEDIVFSVIQNLAFLFGGVLVVALVLKRNLLAYIFMLYSSLLLSSGWILFEQTNVFFKINGVILLVFAVLPLIGYVIMRNRKLQDKKSDLPSGSHEAP